MAASASSPHQALDTYFASLVELLGEERCRSIGLPTDRKRARSPSRPADARPPSPDSSTAAAAQDGLDSSSRGDANGGRDNGGGGGDEGAPPEPNAASGGVLALPDLSRNGWVDRNKHKWVCQTSSAPPQAFETNLFLSKKLEEVAERYKATKQQEWRAFTLERQAKQLRALDFEVTDARQLEAIKGFGRGSSTIDKVAELLRDGKLRKLEMMEGTLRTQVTEEFLKIHGVGAVTANDWWAKGYRSIDEVVRHDREQVARGLPGVLTAQQRVGAKHYEDLTHRIPREEVAAIVDAVRRALHAVLRADGVPDGALDAAAEAIGAGSYRRGKPDSGDVDVLLYRRDGRSDRHLIGEVLDQLVAAGCACEHLANEDDVSYGGLSAATKVGHCKSYRGVIKLPGRARFRRLDLKVYPEEQIAYALLYFTGSDHFNRSMRHYAQKRGYSLSDHGIVHACRVPGRKESVRGTKNLVRATTEHDIFRALGLEYVEPSLRNTDVTPVRARDEHVHNHHAAASAQAGVHLAAVAPAPGGGALEVVDEEGEQQVHVLPGCD